MTSITWVLIVISLGRAPPTPSHSDSPTGNHTMVIAGFSEHMCHAAEERINAGTLPIKAMCINRSED